MKLNFLTGALCGLILVTSGCKTPPPDCRYKGKIGEDRVSYFEQRCAEGLYGRVLIVEKPNGRTLEFRDYANYNLKSLSITRDGNTVTVGLNDVFEKSLRREAQRQFNSYMAEIKQRVERTNLAKLAENS